MTKTQKNVTFEIKINIENIQVKSNLVHLHSWDITIIFNHKFQFLLN